MTKKNGNAVNVDKVKRSLHPNVRARKEKEKLEKLDKNVSSGKHRDLAPKETIMVPIGQIFVERSWNMRSGTWEEDTGADEESTGFQGFVDSMREGQDTAVKIRKTPKGVKTDCPFMLISGFKRLTALRRVADETKNPDLLVRCELEDVTEVEARLLNIRENTIRENPKTPDLCWAVGELKKLGMPIADVARKIGKSYIYTQKLARIGELPPALFDEWRKSPMPLSADKMLLCVNPEDGRSSEEVYKELQKELSARPNRFQKTEEEKLSDLKKKAYSLGELLGKLAREGFIDTAFGDFAEPLGLMLKLENAPENRRSEVIEAFRAGYENETKRDSPPKKSEASKTPSGGADAETSVRT